MHRLAMPSSDCAENLFSRNPAIIACIIRIRPDLFFLGDNTVSVESHDMGEATVYIGDFTRDAGSEIGQKEGGCVADFLDSDITAKRCVLCDEIQQDVEVADTAGCNGLDRAG